MLPVYQKASNAIDRSKPLREAYWKWLSKNIDSPLPGISRGLVSTVAYRRYFYEEVYTPLAKEVGHKQAQTILSL